MKDKILYILKKNRLTYRVGVWVNILIFNYLYDSLRYARYLLVKQGILKNTKFEQIRRFKNIHIGERCFIVATGPSLTYDDLSKLKNECCFGVNSIIRSFVETEWRPTYYGIQDANVYEKLEHELGSVDLANIFVGHRIGDRFHIPQHYIPYFHFSCFHSKHGDLVAHTSGFSSEASEIIYDGYSVTYSMLQLAVYMGFSDIYLLGTDCSYNKNSHNYFIDSGWKDKNATTVGERMIYGFSVAKKYAEKHGVHIFNATRGGMLDAFDRVDLDEVLNSKNER